MATEPVEASAADIALLVAATGVVDAAAVDTALLAISNDRAVAAAVDIALLAIVDLDVNAAFVTAAVIAIIGGDCPPARTTEELLQRLFRFLPPGYASAEPLLAGIARAQSDGEQVALCLQDVLPFGPMTVTLPGGSTVDYSGATDIWLDLHARGYGILRSPGEADAELRARLREVTERVTRPAILDAVDLLLVPFAVSATMVEWFEEPYLDLVETVAVGGMYLDSTLLSGGPSSFVLYVPSVGPGYSAPVYGAIVSLVETLRSAGVQWRLIVGDPPP